MIAYMCSIIVNYFSFVDTFIGLDFVAGVAVVLAAIAIVYKLGHTKTL